jgi:hypothetical protein
MLSYKREYDKVMESMVAVISNMLLTNPKMPIAELMTNGDDDNITF